MAQIRAMRPERVSACLERLPETSPRCAPPDDIRKFQDVCTRILHSSPFRRRTLSGEALTYHRGNPRQPRGTLYAEDPDLPNEKENRG